MLAIKGFISHSLMATNTPGQNALIGELSTYAATYAREKGYYGALSAPQYLFTAFKSTEDDVKIALPTAASEHVLTIAKYVLDQTISSTDAIFADELLNELISNFAAVAEEFSCGEIVNDGRYYAPEWLAWKSKVAELGENQIRIWFADASFRLQYDEFEITVVPPLANLDDFFLAGGTVETKLNAKTVTDFTNDLQAAKQGHPETIMKIEQFDYVNPLDPAHTVSSKWGLLIYGAAGNNVDSIKDALVQFILANSTRTREQWAPILPDIFKRTEFVLIPRWDKYAIPNRTVEAGIHSPVTLLTEALQKAVAVIGSGYPTAHINSHVAVLLHPYKSLSVLAVGSPENRDNKWEILDIFPDYIAVASTSQDWNRMSNSTKNWALLLEELLLAAEVVQDFTSVPLGMTKVKRNGVLYVVRSYENVHYLVASKQSIAPPEAP